MPGVQRPSESAASRASASSASETPKPALAASVPAIDWKTRSTGAPASIACSVLVTCVSTQLCVGMAWRAISASSRYSRSTSAGMLSPAGLTPITASPAP